MSSAAGFTPLPASECRAPGAGGGGTPGMRILGRARLGRLPRRSPGFSGKGLALSCGCSAPGAASLLPPRPSPNPSGSPRRHASVPSVLSTQDTRDASARPTGSSRCRHGSGSHPPSFSPKEKPRCCVGQRERVSRAASERRCHRESTSRVGGGTEARTPPGAAPQIPPVRWQRGCARSSGDLPPAPHPAALSIRPVHACRQSPATAHHTRHSPSQHSLPFISHLEP